MKLESPASEIRGEKIFLLSFPVNTHSFLDVTSELFLCLCVQSFFFNFFFFFFFFGSVWSSLLHGLFSSCSEHGLLSSCGTQASHCSGSSCGAGFLGTRASVIVARGLENTGSVVVMHRLSCYVGSSHIKD